MRTNLKTPVLLIAAVVLLTACASAPKRNAMLDEATSTYQRATADPEVVRNAAVELQQARAALTQAESALAQDETQAVDHYAYLAKRRTEAALETAKTAASNDSVRTAQSDRQRILLQARETEARAQRERADQSLQQAQSERQRAEAAREQAQTAQESAARQQAEAQAAQERANKLASELDAMRAKKTDRGMVLTLGDVLFDTASASLKPGANRILEQVTAFLKEHPERKIQIEGHTDSVGSADYNQTLSEHRAVSVKNALVARGVDESRISARGFGEAMPTVGNNTAAGRQQNRRVEIVFPDVG